MSYCGLDFSYPITPAPGYNVPNILFNFGVPRKDVFDYNIFNYTGDIHFPYLGQQSIFGANYYSPINLTLPGYDIFYNSTDNWGFFDFLRPKSTTPHHTVNNNGMFSFLYGNTPISNTSSTVPKNLSSSLTGYSPQKGNLLANKIKLINTGFDNYCARHVKEAIQMAGLGDYINGDAYQMASILSKNKNFKEISATNLKNLPAGCILVYNKGVAGYSSEYGHTEITLGDGTAASGGITKNIRSGARVFIPV